MASYYYYCYYYYYYYFSDFCQDRWGQFHRKGALAKHIPVASTTAAEGGEPESSSTSLQADSAPSFPRKSSSCGKQVLSLDDSADSVPRRLFVGNRGDSDRQISGFKKSGTVPQKLHGIAGSTRGEGDRKNPTSQKADSYHKKHGISSGGSRGEGRENPNSDIADSSPSAPKKRMCIGKQVLNLPYYKCYNQVGLRLCKTGNFTRPMGNFVVASITALTLKMRVEDTSVNQGSTLNVLPRSPMAPWRIPNVI